MDELASEFLSEAAEALGGLQAGVARLAADAHDRAAAIELLRRLHGLKGLAGFFGFCRAETLIHAGESLVEAVAGGHASPAALAALSVMFERLGQLIADSDGGLVEPDGDDTLLLVEMAAAAELVGEPSGALRFRPQAAAPSPILLRTENDPRGRAPWIGLDTLAQALGDRLGKRIGLAVGGDDLRIAPAAARPLRLALIALVRNACDHGVEGPAERRAAAKPALALLRLSVHRRGEGAIIELADDGRGIDPERIRAHCLAIGRLDPKTAASLDPEATQALVFAVGVTTAAEVGPVSGRGLGLELVRSEIESLGGEVAMASTPGHGVRFVLTVPASAIATPAVSRPRGGLKRGRRPVKICLVVDDSRVVRKVARRILEGLDFEIAEAGDGMEALAFCRAAMPDAVLLDWAMPVMDGLEFVRRLRQEPGGEGPVVVFCTSENEPARIAEALEDGADEYIMKPFDGDIIEAKFVQAGLI